MERWIHRCGIRRVHPGCTRASGCSAHPRASGRNIFASAVASLLSNRHEISQMAQFHFDFAISIPYGYRFDSKDVLDASAILYESDDVKRSNRANSVKTVSPGGMKTDFFTRSFDTGLHPAYDQLVDRVMSKITDPRQMETYSSPGQIAEVVYEAATDGKKQLRYVAGADAKATYAMRLQMGDEAFRNAINQQFFGQ